MATVAKYKRNPQGWNKDKLLSELIAATGKTPTVTLSANGANMEVIIPTGVSTALVDRIVNAHKPGAIYEAKSLVFAGEAGKLDGNAVQLGISPAVQAAITSTMGVVMNTGTIVWGTSDNPYDPDFSGLVLGGPTGFEWPLASGTYYRLLSINAGVLDNGIGADGPIYAGAGAVTLDTTGALYRNGVLPVYQEVANVAGSSVFRLGGLGAYNGELGNVVLMSLAREVSALTTNNITNGNFETGDLTGWTTTGTGTGTAAINTANARFGKYCAELTSGTGTVKLTSGRYTSFPQVLSCRALVNGNNGRINVNYYDNASAGSLISATQTPINQSSGSDIASWSQYIVPVIAPSGALSFTVEFELSTASTTAYIDEVELSTLANPPGIQSFGFNTESDAGGPLYWRNDMRHRAHYGDYAGYAAAPDDTNENTLYTRTLKANSLGTKGTFRFVAKIRTTNNGDASNYTATVRFKWNGSTVFTGASLGLSANANRQTTGFYEFTVTNVNSASAQELTLDEQVNANRTIAQMGSGQTPTPLNYWATASVATTADVAVALTVQKSTADTDFDVELLGVWADGPYYS